MPKRDSSNIDLSLAAPSAFLFTGETASRAYALNKLAFDFKRADIRAQFATDAEGLMDAYGLSAQQKQLIHARDWTGLVAAGGHHFNIIKIAAAVGLSHMHVGAHMAGAEWREFKTRLPRLVDLMPEDID